jgi:ADP-heptose:LPS heptosyltransferase
VNVDFQRRIDRILGVPLCRLLSLWPSVRRGNDDLPPPRRILVILLSEMGSLVLTQPMFARLRERHPKAEFYAILFDRNREVLDLLEVLPAENILILRSSSLASLMADTISAVRSLRRLRVEVAIDCELFSRFSALLSFLSGAAVRVGFHRHKQEGLYRGDFMNRPVPYNPYQHIARQFVTLVEAIDGGGTPLVKRAAVPTDLDLRALKIDEDEIVEMRERFLGDYPAARERRLVLLYAGGGLLPIRAWPLQSFIEVAKGVLSDGHAVGIVGLASDRELAQAIQSEIASERCFDLTGYTKTVRELVYLFHYANLLITNDGGPGHFASVTPIPSILLFGPETPVLYGSLSPRAVHFYVGLSCSPCLTAYNHRNSPCDGDNQCLKQIRWEDVLGKARELLATSGSRSLAGV